MIIQDILEIDGLDVAVKGIVEESAMSPTDILAAFFTLHQEYTGELSAQLIDIWRFKCLLDSLLDGADTPTNKAITMEDIEQTIGSRSAFEIREEDGIIICDMNVLQLYPVYIEEEEMLGELADKAYQQLLEERGGLL